MATTYTQGYDASTLKSHQSRTAEAQADYLLPHIQPTSQVLDVGCGPGTITCGFAKYASQGHVTGVDFSEQVIEQARTEAAGRGIKNISFDVASAFSLPFEDGIFDVVHAHAVLMHLPNASSAVKEMRRVCKTGGFLGCREGDRATQIMFPYNPLLEKWKEVTAQLVIKEGAEPNAGRCLAQWALDAGFTADRVKVTSNVLQYFGKDEVKWWATLSAQRIRAESGERAVDSGLISRNEIEQISSAYLDWGNQEAAIWVMTHMRLLCQK